LQTICDLTGDNVPMEAAVAPRETLLPNNLNLIETTDDNDFNVLLRLSNYFIFVAQLTYNNN
jgi:hypothetical protein